MTDREEFLQIFRQHVTRPGSEKLLDWLDHKTVHAQPERLPRPARHLFYRGRE